MGAASMAGATVTTNQRTRIGLTLTTIRIPIPCLRLVPIQDGAETTIRFAGSQSVAQGAFGGVPMGVPLAAGSLTGAPGSFVQGQVVGPPVSTQIVPGPAAAPSAAPNAAPGAQAGPSCAPAGPNAITPERVQALTKKIEELEAAKKEQDAKKDAGPIPPPHPKKEN